MITVKNKICNFTEHHEYPYAVFFVNIKSNRGVSAFIVPFTTNQPSPLPLFFLHEDPIYLQAVIIHSANGGKG
jgi:hypothetical protein